MALFQALYDEHAIELFELLNDKNESGWLDNKNAEHNIYSKLTMGVIKKYPNKPWDWVNVCQFSIITIDDIRNNPNLNHWTNLTMNDNIDVMDILKNQDLSWDWEYFYHHRYIHFQCIVDYPNLDWNWYALFRSRYLIRGDEIDFVVQHLDKPWNWSDISKGVNENTIAMYPDLPWDWKMISENHNITLNFIKQNLNKPWNWKIIANRRFKFYEFNGVATRNMFRMLIATIHEYYTDGGCECDFPLSHVELFFADAYLVKYVMHAMDNKYFEMLEEFL